MPCVITLLYFLTLTKNSENARVKNIFGTMWSAVGSFGVACAPDPRFVCSLNVAVASLSPQCVSAVSLCCCLTPGSVHLSCFLLFKFPAKTKDFSMIV
ncbi:hypothetical protein FKM82_008013 [Ascaphus truei]